MLWACVQHRRRYIPYSKFGNGDKFKFLVSTEVRNGPHCDPLLERVKYKMDVVEAAGCSVGGKKMFVRQKKIQLRIQAKLIVSLLLALLLAVGAAGCSGGGGDVDEVKAQGYTVDFTGVNPSDSGKTYGEFIDSYCPGGEWRQFTSNGDRIVEYNGGDSPEGSVNIQWAKSSSGWSVWAMEINGEGISQFHINTFFSSAQSAAGEPIEPVDEQPTEEPAAEVDPTPAEPYITTAELNGLTAENSPHFTKVINAHDAETKGKEQYTIQNPNTQNVDLINIDLDPGVTPEVSKYVPYEKGEPLDVPGTVIKLGKQELKQGELYAGKPNMTIYVFDGEVTPEQFAAATRVSWDPFQNASWANDSVKSKSFPEIFLESKSQPGQYHDVAWGIAETVGLPIPKGVNVGDVLHEKNSAIKIDIIKFNTDKDFEKDGGAYPVGSIITHKNMGDKTVFVVEQYMNSDNHDTVQLPNSNNTGFHDMYNQAALDTNLSIPKTYSDGKYTIIRPGEGMTTPGENVEQ
jgi:hypothetical protein